MLTRRSFGAAALGLGAALPIASGAAAAASSSFSLGPGVAKRWAKHQSQSAPRLLQLPNGVRLQSGPMGAVDKNGLAIWSRASWTGDFRAAFKTRKLDANTGAGDQRLFLLFYFGVQGDGTQGRPANPADWPGSTVPYTHAYADHVRGARISFYLQLPGDGETGPLGAAYFKADGSRNSVKPGRNVAFPGLRDVVYGWTIRRVGNAVTVTQTDGGASRSVTFSSPGFGQYAASGSFGLLVAPGRIVEVTDLTIGGA